MMCAAPVGVGSEFAGAATHDISMKSLIFYKIVT